MPLSLSHSFQRKPLKTPNVSIFVQHHYLLPPFRNRVGFETIYNFRMLTLQGAYTKS